MSLNYSIKVKRCENEVQIKHPHLSNMNLNQSSTIGNVRKKNKHFPRW